MSRSAAVPLLEPAAVCLETARKIEGKLSAQHHKNKDARQQAIDSFRPWAEAQRRLVLEHDMLPVKAGQWPELSAPMLHTMEQTPQQKVISL